MDVLQMKSVVASVELGSFTKAGEALFMSPQTVKNQIDLLELELGVRLFVRSKKGLIATAEGLLLHDSCRKLLDDIDKATAAIKSLDSNVVCLEIPGNSNQPLRDLICAGFTEKYPGITLNYMVNNNPETVLEYVLDGHTNAVFWPLDKKAIPDSLAFHACPAIPPAQYYAVMAENNPLARRTSVSLNDLSRASAASHKPFYWGLPEDLDCVVVDFPSAYDRYSIINYCQNGGTYVCCDYMPIAYSGLISIPIDFPPEPFGIVTRAKPTTAVCEFVEYCVAWRANELKA